MNGLEVQDIGQPAIFTGDSTRWMRVTVRARCVLTECVIAVQLE